MSSLAHPEHQPKPTSVSSQKTTAQVQVPTSTAAHHLLSANLTSATQVNSVKPARDPESDVESEDSEIDIGDAETVTSSSSSSSSSSASSEKSSKSDDKTKDGEEKQNKTRSKVRRYDSHGSYIKRIVKTMLPDFQIQEATISVINQMMCNLTKLLIAEVRELTSISAHAHKKTLQVREIDAAIRLIVKNPMLLNKVLSRTKKAINTFQTAKNKKAQRMSGEKNAVTAAKQSNANDDDDNDDDDDESQSDHDDGEDTNEDDESSAKTKKRKLSEDTKEEAALETKPKKESASSDASALDSKSKTNKSSVRKSPRLAKKGDGEPPKKKTKL
jgi:hypothetical protein